MVCSFSAIIIDLAIIVAVKHVYFDSMFIIRLVILLVIVATLLWLLKRVFSADPEPEQIESANPENMRQCKYCGVHVPESSIVSVQDEPYCCQEHADLDQQ